MIEKKLNGHFVFNIDDWNTALSAQSIFIMCQPLFSHLMWLVMVHLYLHNTLPILVGPNLIVKLFDVVRSYNQLVTDELVYIQSRGLRVYGTLHFLIFTKHSVAKF